MHEAVQLSWRQGESKYLTRFLEFSVHNREYCIRLSTCVLEYSISESNTDFHMLVVDAHYGARPAPAADDRTVVRLMRYLDDDNMVTKDGVIALREAVKRAMLFAERFGAGEVIGMATSALREAANGPEVLRELEEVGTKFQVLSGKEGANLTFLAARRWHGWAAGRLLVLDIGGGSFEVAYGVDENPEFSASVPLGAGRFNSSLPQARSAARGRNLGHESAHQG